MRVVALIFLFALSSTAQRLDIDISPEAIHTEELGGGIVPVSRVFFHVIFHNVSDSPIEIGWVRFDLVGTTGGVVSGQFSGSALIHLFDSAIERRRIEPTPSGTLLIGSDQRKALSDVVLDLPTGLMGKTLIVEVEFMANGESFLQKVSKTLSSEKGFVGRLPFEGNWYVAEEHGFIDSHKRFVSEAFAYDFLLIGEGGKSYVGSGSRNIDYLAYRQSVLAAKDGEVVYMRKDVPENVPGKAMPAVPGGNAIVIKHNDDQYTYYAHLTPSGMRFGVGDKVVEGDVIGEVGNSGDSVEPHLHFHAMRGPDPGDSSGIPTLFERWISNAYGRNALIRSYGVIPRGTFVQP